MVYAVILKTAALALTVAASANTYTTIFTHVGEDGKTYSKVVINHRGCQVTEFYTASNPTVNILFKSGEASTDLKLPERSGSTITFPNRYAHDGLPIEGFAHSTLWTPVGKPVISPSVNVPSVANFTVESSGATRNIWPFNFKLVCEVRLFADQLETVVLNADTQEINFQLLLQNYLFVEIVLNKGVTVTGLKGVSYIDIVTETFHEEKREIIDIAARTDIVYQNAPNKVSAFIKKGINTFDSEVRRRSRLSA